MIGMTPAVIATHYLDHTRQWGRVGADRRAEAIQAIAQGKSLLAGHGARPWAEEGSHASCLGDGSCSPASFNPWTQQATP